MKKIVTGIIAMAFFCTVSAQQKVSWAFVAKKTTKSRVWVARLVAVNKGFLIIHKHIES